MTRNDLRKNNITLNDVEYRSKKIILESTPQYITVGAHYLCNAKCIFCLGGNYPKFSIDIYKKLFESKINNVLCKAKHVGFCGWGELLLMPEIEAFLDYINLSLPEQTGKVFTTNGLALNEKLCSKLLEYKSDKNNDVAPYSILVSLHASNPQLHEFITKTKTYEKIVGQISKFVKLSKKYNTSSIHLRLIFLANKINIDNLPDFIMLAKKIGIEEVTCNYLTIYEPEHVKYSCFFCQDKTKEMFKRAMDMANSLQIKLTLPPLFGENVNNETCSDPWNFSYVETQGSVNPCCFAGNHIGYLDKDEFETIWNGPGYTKLRESLINGNTHSWCKYCYKYNTNNVNDIRSHITFRPETQRKILSWLRENSNEYPIPEESLEL